MPNATVNMIRTAVIPGGLLGMSGPVASVWSAVYARDSSGIQVFEQMLEKLTGEATMASVESQAEADLLNRLSHLTLSLQRCFNVPVFGNSESIQQASNPQFPQASIWISVMPCLAHRCTAEVFGWVVQQFNAYIDDADGWLQGIEANWPEQAARLQSICEPYAVSGTNIRHFLRAAHQLGIATQSITPTITAYGYGAHSRWFESSLTDKTPMLGTVVAKNKSQTAHILRQFGLPVPQQRYVSDEQGAEQAAVAMGYPVVIKPDNQDQGKGVFVYLTNAQAVRESFAAARTYSKTVLVEPFYQGQDYRLTVFQGQVVKVMHRRAPMVTGNGVSSVEQLIKSAQQSPHQQAVLRRTGVTRLAIDDEMRQVLQQQHVSLTDVPDAGTQVLLRRKSNISSGGEHNLVPIDRIHPDNCTLAIRAAAILNLDIAGIDLITPDISQSWLDTNAVICEVNAVPQLGYREMPELYARVLTHEVPNNGHIPIYMMLLAEDAPIDTQQALAVAQQQRCNGVSLQSGIWIDGTQQSVAFQNGFAAARALLLDRSVTAALLVVTARDIVNFGMPAADFEFLDSPLSIPKLDGTEAIQSRYKLAKNAIERHRQLRKTPPVSAR